MRSAFLLMPETYQIDEAQSVIWTRCWGVLSDEDIQNQQTRLRHDPRFRPTFHHLVDTTAVTDVAISGKMVLQMGQSTLFAPEARRAYVATKDVLFGLARMYELYQGTRGQQSVRVFRHRAEALAWLGVRGTAAEQQSA